MFIQPKVTLENGQVTLLDEVIGARFAIIAWGCNPQWGLNDEQIARWRAVGVRFIQVVPEVQIHCDQDNVPGVIRVGDTQNRLKSWFAQHDTAIAVVRPDRFVATVAIPQTLSKSSTRWRARCSWLPRRRQQRLNRWPDMNAYLHCLSHTPLVGYVDPEQAVLDEVNGTIADARARIAAFDPELVVLFAPITTTAFSTM
jgi:hypothetical protein